MNKLDDLISEYNRIKYQIIPWVAEDQVRFYNRQLKELDRRIKQQQRETVNKKGCKLLW